jgi:hypothetical protein
MTSMVAVPNDTVQRVSRGAVGLGRSEMAARAYAGALSRGLVLEVGGKGGDHGLPDGAGLLTATSDAPGNTPNITLKVKNGINQTCVVFWGAELEFRSNRTVGAIYHHRSDRSSVRSGVMCVSWAAAPGWLSRR